MMTDVGDERQHLFLSIFNENERSLRRKLRGGNWHWNQRCL